MNRISRRSFVSLGSSLMAAGLTLPAACTAAGVRRGDETCLPPMIHAADLYHYHCDPDDHWDLASIYALAYAGLAENGDLTNEVFIQLDGAGSIEGLNATFQELMDAFRGPLPQ